MARRFAGDDSLADDIYMFDEDVPVCTLDEVYMVFGRAFMQMLCRLHLRVPSGPRGVRA